MGAMLMPFVSYAQNFEDVMLWRALKHLENGFYIDVGAAWPEMHSVTNTFYLRGWQGINVEPNPELYSQLLKSRPRDINIQIAVSDRDGEVDFNLFPETGLSTLVETIAQEHVERNFNRTSLRVAVCSLDDIWENYVPRDQEVHFLKVDVEGFEDEVLRSNNWLVHRPWIVLVESTLPLSQVEAHQVWEPTLIAASYVFAYADGLNRFYIDNNHLDLLSAFKYPPNVFDEFVLASEVSAEEAQRHAEARAVSAEEAQRHAEARAVSAEEAQRHAEAHAAELNFELTALIDSKSWWVTRPLRYAFLQLTRLQNIARHISYKLSIAHSTASIVAMLNWAKKIVNRSPMLTRLSMYSLNKFPNLGCRISFALDARNKLLLVGPFTVDPLHDVRLTKLEKLVTSVIDEINIENKNESSD